MVIMVMGTASNAGKSLIATALCRIFARNGRRVAPFKAQNMSLNSAATPDGLEIGRAQALQAEAARVAPRSDMNPVLLKPMSLTGAQAVVNGRVWGNLYAGDYLGKTKRELWPFVCAAFDRLAAEFDTIVVEGAGSPAEINLREHDIVNMSVAHYTGARALLVADIDRGGAFAAVAGTFALLDERDRACFGGYAFNKFRGNAALLDPGIAMLAERTPVPCLGVVPFLDVRGLDEEDGVSLETRLARSRPWTSERRLRVAVVAFPHLSNNSDLDALEEEPSVDVRFARDGALLDEADVVILPGTKDTMGDLRWARTAGIDDAVRRARARKAVIVGICGGMQMLGERIDDPQGVERGGSEEGIGVLALRSWFAPEKCTFPVSGVSDAFGAATQFAGYEIHAGVTEYAPESRPFASIRRASGEAMRDGIVADGGRTIGTYVHGLFGGDAVRHAFLRWAHARCGLAASAFVDVSSRRDARIDALADAVEAALDLDALTCAVSS